MSIQPKTVYRLMLGGFVVVAIPLMIGLLVLFFQIERLSTSMQATVNQSASVMETSRLITAQTLNLRRTASQYLILLDPALLSRYRDQRDALRNSLDALQELPIDIEMTEDLEQIERVENALFEKLNDVEKRLENRLEDETIALPPQPAELELLDAYIETIPTQASDIVARAREDMAARSQRSKRSLIILLLTVVPTAVILAIISSIVINRPLKKIISLIRQLGQGEFPQDTHVGGPRNIEALGEQLRWLSTRLSEIEQQKVIFLQNISHELKTPLTAIREGTDLLREQVTGTLNDEQREVLDIMNQNTFLLQNQLESLLDFNLALTVDEPFSQVPVNLKQIIEKIVDKLHLILKSRQINIAHDTPSARIVGNQAQLECLFENILTNAIKYSPKGGTIRIDTEIGDKDIKVVVLDSGPGFSDEEVHLVFKPFFQGSKSPESHIKGTGLGLSIAKRYADLHGGTIEIANAKIGAAVQVLLPVNNNALANES